MVASCLSLCTGCGQSDPRKYRVEGAVVYDGKPVPKGMVVFTPDGASGNNGPGTQTEIRDGRYSTPKGKGSIGGRYVVRIEGIDASGKPLFPFHEEKLDLPEESSTRDFDIPVQIALKPKPAPAAKTGSGAAPGVRPNGPLVPPPRPKR